MDSGVIQENSNNKLSYFRPVFLVVSQRERPHFKRSPSTERILEVVLLGTYVYVSMLIVLCDNCAGKLR